MLVSSIGYMDNKGLRGVEEYSVQSRYDNASLFGQIEHNPVDFAKFKSTNNIFSAIKNFCTSKKEITEQQALNIIA